MTVSQAPLLMEPHSQSRKGADGLTNLWEPGYFIGGVMLKEKIEDYTQEDIETLESKFEELTSLNTQAQETIQQLTTKQAELAGELKAAKELNQKLVLGGGVPEKKQSMEELLYEAYTSKRGGIKNNK